MNGKYSLPVVKAVDLIWTSFDREEIRRGYAMLMQAAQQGDADALCLCGHLRDETAQRRKSIRGAQRGNNLLRLHVGRRSGGAYRGFFSHTTELS